MTRFGWMVVSVVILVIAGIASFIFLVPKQAVVPVPVETGNENLEGQSIYASGEYGFTLQYPSSAKEHDEFSTTYTLSRDWRVGADPDATGTPVVEIVGYETKSDHSFPRNFSALVRIGVATSSKEVAACTKITMDRGETARKDFVVNGTTWKAFEFQDAAMMHYVKGVSYRTVHGGKCFALEKIATGSSYMDDPDSADDIAQSRLDQAYADLDAIVESFAFTKP